MRVELTLANLWLQFWKECGKQFVDFVYSGSGIKELLLNEHLEHFGANSSALAAVVAQLLSSDVEPQKCAAFHR